MKRNQVGRASCIEGSDVVRSRDRNRRWRGEKSRYRVAGSARDVRTVEDMAKT